MGIRLLLGKAHLAPQGRLLGVRRPNDPRRSGSSERISRTGCGQTEKQEPDTAQEQRKTHLGCDVVGRATECGRGPPRQHALLAHAEVGQLAVALGVQEDVVQLQVAVDDEVAVEEHEGEGDLSCVESGASLVKATCPLNLEHQVTAVHVLHDEEEAVLQERSNCLIRLVRGH